MEGGVPVLSPASAGQSRPGAGASVAPGPSERSRHMQVGMIGLGRMGANLVRRLMRAGHECVVYDVNPAMIEPLVSEGATGSATLDEFVAALTVPRVAWVMVPAAFAGETVLDVAGRMEPGDIVIDGGN